MAEATVAEAETVSAVFDASTARRDFPLLAQRRGGKRLVYLDSAATAQKPQVVIDRVSAFYTAANANIHRGVYRLSETATAQYEATRAATARWLNASPTEIIFTRGTTESINLVAQSFLRRQLRSGDDILVTQLEHHSNIVPWQLVAAETGAVLRPVPLTRGGDVDLAVLENMLGPRTRLLAVAHVSNAIGTVNPVERITALAHSRGVPVLVDGAQSAPHVPIDVQAIGCDFFACSSHKMYGPTGVGVLYGREALLDAMPPWQGGGDMIASVTFEHSSWAGLPAKFEAGTPNIAGVIGFGAALDYLRRLGQGAVARHEADVLDYAVGRLESVPGVRVVGTPQDRLAVVSFVMDGAHPHDIATILDAENICIRAGHHCAQPLMAWLGVPATARASFACYSTVDEVDLLVAGLRAVRRVLGS